MSQFAKPAHKSVMRGIGYALSLGDEAAWDGVTTILMARLTDGERASLAYAALNSLSHDHAYMAASVSLYGVLDGEVVQ